LKNLKFPGTEEARGKKRTKAGKLDALGRGKINSGTGGKITQQTGG